jgi:hypothetical protein
LNRKRTVLLYGRSRSGKSTQLGELAEYVYRTTGKKSRIYTADRGGIDPIYPYVELGIVEVVEQGDTDIFIFLNKACQGQTRDKDGKWVKGDNSNIGMFAFESMTAFADGIMTSMVQKAADGVSVGGGANVSFTVTGDGESLKVSGSNMAMYGICQSRITDEVWRSQKLDADYIVWTASASKDEDQNAGGKVIGPAVIGKALTAEVPRWFNLSFRIDSLPAQQGKSERHILYLGNSVDIAAGNAVSLGNTRTALDAPPLPSSIEPASLSKALEMIKDANAKATEVLKKRMGVK